MTDNEIRAQRLCQVKFNELCVTVKFINTKIKNSGAINEWAVHRNIKKKCQYICGDYFMEKYTLIKEV